MKLRLPKKIQLGGIEITINQIEGMVEQSEVIGRADYPGQGIDIDPSAAPHDWTMQAYYHEKVHWILHMMSHPLQNNEEFVDMFSHLLYQSDKSAEFE
jgi:hypothetical protein